ncbi:MAG: hypothetical protein GXY61_07080 [Lentisphaerae bacterium]|jgi:hypothetical protein|nr:hypothetical protein [Lentisphaerota bacterium]
MMNKKNILDAINRLFERAPYFSINAMRDALPEYKPNSVKSYVSLLKIEGLIFDAGCGWYSSIKETYRLDTAPVEKLVEKLKTSFPSLEVVCWSTEQLNDMLLHQPAKHVQFAYVERPAINRVADKLRKSGYHVYANPGKEQIRRTFKVEDNTVVVLPITTESPQSNGFAAIEKIMVDVLADALPFAIINIDEFCKGASTLIRKYRIDICLLNRYSIRRKRDILSLLDKTLFN